MTPRAGPRLCIAPPTTDQEEAGTWTQPLSVVPSKSETRRAPASGKIAAASIAKEASPAFASETAAASLLPAATVASLPLSKPPLAPPPLLESLPPVPTSPPWPPAAAEPELPSTEGPLSVPPPPVSLLLPPFEEPAEPPALPGRSPDEHAPIVPATAKTHNLTIGTVLEMNMLSASILRARYRPTSRRARMQGQSSARLVLPTADGPHVVRLRTHLIVLKSRNLHDHESSRERASLRGDLMKFLCALLGDSWHTTFNRNAEIQEPDTENVAPFDLSSKVLVLSVH